MASSTPDSTAPEPVDNLAAALAAMTFEVEAGRYALCGFEELPTAADLKLIECSPGQITREAGESSLLIHMNHLAVVREIHPAAQVEEDLVWIRFQAAMGWEVVGFLAKVTTALAEVGVPLGAVCGYSRDHLFIHERYLPTTLEVLQTLFPATRTK